MATTTATTTATSTTNQEQAYANMTNEDLVILITAAHETAGNAASTADSFTLNDALDQLFKNLAPITLNRAEMYRGKMDTYDTEDFLQVGKILIWEIIQKGELQAWEVCKLLQRCHHPPPCKHLPRLHPQEADLHRRV